MVYSVLLKAHVSRSMEKEQIDRQTDTLTHTHTHTHMTGHLALAKYSFKPQKAKACS